MAKTVNIQNIRDDYREIAKDYDARWHDFLDLPHHWIINNMEKPGKVIDLGCGTGRLLSMIANRFPDAKLTGIDCSADMLEIASARLEGEDVLVADIENMDMPDGPFDAVLSVNVLHHLNDPEAHLELLRALCAPEGAIYVCDFAIDNWKLLLAEQYWRYFHPAHSRAYSHQELNALLEKKFTIEKKALLRLTDFWRLQAYKLGPLSPLQNRKAHPLPMHDPHKAELKKEKQQKRLLLKSAGAAGLGLGLLLLKFLIVPFLGENAEAEKALVAFGWCLIAYGGAIVLSFIFLKKHIFKINLLLTWIVLPLIVIKFATDVM